MNPYNITDAAVLEVLNQHCLYPTIINKLPRSGQRQVFEMEFPSGKESILKFVDVSPYHTHQRLEWNELSLDDLEQEKKYEIEANSKRIVRELQASKKCPILPQLEIIEDYQTYIKDPYHFIYYFETKFEGQTLNNSELYHQEQGIEAVIQFLLQMVIQIKVMHDAGYVHRDLTPRNIIYNQGTFKIIDAGLVKSNEDESLTATQALIGTPRFMAPEQEKRTSDYTWDFRTDLYSIGLIAIEIFLPVTRYHDKRQKRDLHYVLQLWRDKDGSSQSMLLFSKVITRLAIEERHRRWSDLEELLNVLENLTGEEVR